MGSLRPGYDPDSFEFYRFFCRWSSDGRAAILSVAAGSIGGGILTITVTIAGIISHFSSSLMFPMPLILLTTSLCSAVATYATWKRVIAGAVINALIGVAFTSWLTFRTSRT